MATFFCNGTQQEAYVNKVRLSTPNIHKASVVLYAKSYFTCISPLAEMMCPSW